MMLINGEPMIYRQIERIGQSKAIDRLIVATSIDPSDDKLADFLQLKGISVYRGELDDVLSRFLEIEKATHPSVIVRLTGDCPLVMPELIDEMVAQFYESKLDYLSNTLKLTFPDGLDIEIIRSSVLIKVLALNPSIAEREHVTLGIYRRPGVFKIDNFSNNVDLSQHRWTVDYLEDLIFVRQVFDAFKGREASFNLEDLMQFLSSNPGLKSAISADLRNERLGSA